MHEFREFGEELFRLLVETVQDYAIFAMDAQGRIVHWNEGARRITGYDEHEVLGDPLSVIFTPEQIEAGVPERELEAAAATGRSEDERWHVRKDGSRFWALGVVVPLRAPDGSLRGYGKILRDRTDLKELQENLKARADSLHEDDKRKNVFLATLSHELRNPMAPLANAIHLLRVHARDLPQLAQLAELMDRQMRQLRRLVDDLLDVTRITQSKLGLSRARVDLVALVDDTIDSARSQADAQRVRLHRVVVTDVPVQVDADRERLQQVLGNLLDNALKFTPAGGEIFISVDIERPEAVVRVRDTGVGIEPADNPRIFELFAQGESRHDGAAGLGLGLSLVRDIVAMHGGSVQALSDGPGKGSEFIVRLPLAQRDEGNVG